jgi:BRCT domain type II-containing protein
LKTSEEEFASLIQALDACWSMAENVQKATARLSEFTDAASANQNVLRESLLEAAASSRSF